MNGSSSGTSLRVERDDPDVAVVVLTGEHESWSAPRLERVLGELLAERSATVVDLTPATFADSATLLALLRGRREADAAGLAFVVQLAEATYVRRIFELTRLTTMFTIVPTRAEALAAVRAYEGRASG